MALLEIKNLTFQYAGSKEKQLDGLSLTVEEGDFVLLAGRSGCGKSTLLRLIKGSLAPNGKQSGEILWEGKSLTALSERQLAFDIGYVMQNPSGQIVTDKVWHELAFALESMGLPSEEINRRVSEISGFFGIGELYRRCTHELSGGQKQILNLASVMVTRPKLLLLDEPTAQLDPIAASTFLTFLKKINEELGMTVIIAEHRLEELFPMATKFALIEDKRLLFALPPPRAAEAMASLHESHPIFSALPLPIRLFHALAGDGVCPITVREGRDYLRTHYQNTYRAVPRQKKSERRRAILGLKDAYFRYHRSSPDILSGLSLTVFESEFLAILGANGAGKTTLLGVLAGLRRPYSGKVLREGMRGAAVFQGVALLPQDPLTLFVRATLRDDLLEAADLASIPKTERDEQVMLIAAKVGVGHLLEKHPYDLSGGEAELAALAKLLLMKPSVILLDEPTKGLDPEAKRTVGMLLRQLSDEGKTVVAVTHDIVFASEYADRSAMYFDGRIVSVASSSDFFADNAYYTTPSLRLSKPYYENAVTFDDLFTLCQMNGKKEGSYE